MGFWEINVIHFETVMLYILNLKKVFYFERKLYQKLSTLA